MKYKYQVFYEMDGKTYMELFFGLSSTEEFLDYLENQLDVTNARIQEI